MTTMPCSSVEPRFAVAAIDHATPDPAGGVIRRATDGEPEGVLLESASTLVSVHIPHMSVADLETAIVGVAHDLLTLGVVAVHDPGGVVRDSDLRLVVPRLRTSRRDRPPSAAGPCLAPPGIARRSARAAPHAAGRCSAETRRVVRASAGRNASLTARSGRERPRCSPISSPNPTGRSRPISGGASGTPSPNSCASSSRAPRPADRLADPRHRRCRGAGRARRPRTDREDRAVHATDRARAAA